MSKLCTAFSGEGQCALAQWHKGKHRLEPYPRSTPCERSAHVWQHDKPPEKGSMPEGTGHWVSKTCTQCGECWDGFEFDSAVRA